MKPIICTSACAAAIDGDAAAALIMIIIYYIAFLSRNQGVKYKLKRSAADFIKNLTIAQKYARNMPRRSVRRKGSASAP